MAKSASQPVSPPRDKKFRIKHYDAGYTGDLSEKAAKECIVDLRQRVAELQSQLVADGRFALLVVLQGMDASGKDGAANSVFRDCGPVGCSVHAFGVPSEEERSHDYLWRIHKAMPEKGKTDIFNRSHYESLLVERVKSLVPQKRWQDRYEEINQFERMLTREGTVILKFFLHISKDEQRIQLQQRIDDPSKQYKFRMGDLDDRKLWDEYMLAYEDVVGNCNTSYAPWYIAPSNHRWYRDIVIAEAVIARLESLKLHFPPAEAGIENLKIE
jgi:PPK2 family polyphosphate:nucleotide phosphotransferase